MTNITCSGGLFLSKETKRFLFLHRTKGKTAGTWGFIGGKNEPTDTSSYEALCREIREEVGRLPNIKKVIPLEQYKSSDTLFEYNTYILIIDREFLPSLNDEHSGYSWVKYDCYPKPLHQGVKATLNNRFIQTKLELILTLL